MFRFLSSRRVNGTGAAGRDAPATPIEIAVCKRRAERGSLHHSDALAIVDRAIQNTRRVGTDLAEIGALARAAAKGGQT